MDIGAVFSAEFWRGAAEAAGLKAWAIAKILIFFFVVRFIAYRLIDRVLVPLAQREVAGAARIKEGRVRTIGTLVKSVVFYVLIFVAGVMILKVFEVDTTPVLTAAGVVGLAVGFGAQKLVRDVITGFFVVLENQYSVGDYITIGAVTGTVEELGMRTTRLRDDVGKLVIIANGDVTQVRNHSRGPIHATLDINVPADADLDKVRSLLDEIGEEVSRKVDGVVEPPKADGITALDASKITICVSGEVKPRRQHAVQMALRELIRDRFAKEEIKLL